MVPSGRLRLQSSYIMHPIVISPGITMDRTLLIPSGRILPRSRALATLHDPHVIAHTFSKRVQEMNLLLLRPRDISELDLFQHALERAHLRRVIFIVLTYIFKHAAVLHHLSGRAEHRLDRAPGFRPLDPGIRLA